MLKMTINCFVTIFSVVLLVTAPAQACKQHKKAAASQSKLEKMTIKSGQKELLFDVEIVSTPAALEHGLMGRKTLPENYGMLFWFGDDAPRTMWMKDTPHALDMLFVDKHGEIIYIKHNATPNSLDKITTDKPARAVIELPGGTAKAKQIQAGDRIEHSYFKS